MIFMVGGGVIACGVLAVIRRDQNLVFIYGSAMIVFAFAVGLTAILTSLETPVLEVAVDGVTDPECMQMAYSMMFGARTTRPSLASAASSTPPARCSPSGRRSSSSTRKLARSTRRSEGVRSYDRFLSLRC